MVYHVNLVGLHCLLEIQASARWRIVAMVEVDDW